jgi:hypothetical protein
VLIMEFAQVGAAFKLGLQLGVVIAWSRWGVLVGVCRSGVVNSWFPFLCWSKPLPTTSR